MSETLTEFGSIERELHIDATPEVVFDVISRPDHIREWWGAETGIEAVVGSTGELVWTSEESGEQLVEAISVVVADRPRRFAFRWISPDRALPTPDNSLLVTFELTPSGSGTLLRVVESGFREMGWDAAVLEQAYHQHCDGWDTHLPLLADVASAASPR
ncbi:MAG: SRPBCC domain-containing protein [Acidimicrobiales bacterium]